MKLIKKVKTIEVKRALVISDRNKRKPLALAKKEVLQLTEPQLNKILLRILIFLFLQSLKNIANVPTVPWHG